MKRNIFIVSTLSALLLSINGCDTTSENPSTPFDGKWSIPNGGLLDIKGNVKNTIANIVNDEALIEGFRSESFDIVGSKTLNNREVSKVDSHLLTCSSFITIKSEELLKSFLTQQLCDADWKLNEKIDLSTCEVFCDFNATKKDIYFLANEGIIQGVIEGELDEEGYPQALNLQEVITPCTNTKECSTFSGISEDSVSNTTSMPVLSMIDGVWEKEGTTITIKDFVFSAVSVIEENSLRINSSINYFVSSEGDKFIEAQNLSATKIELNLLDAEINQTPLTQLSAEKLNSANTCGYSNWKINESKDITACKNLSPSLEQRKDLYYLNNNELIFGSGEEGFDSEGFPNALDNGEVFVKTN